MKVGHPNIQARTASCRGRVLPNSSIHPAAVRPQPRSRTPEGDAIPGYLAKNNLRFQQWILDTCLRPYDPDWINAQQAPNEW